MNPAYDVWRDELAPTEIVVKIRHTKPDEGDFLRAIAAQRQKDLEALFRQIGKDLGFE